MSPLLLKSASAVFSSLQRAGGPDLARRATPGSVVRVCKIRGGSPQICVFSSTVAPTPTVADAWSGVKVVVMPQLSPSMQEGRLTSWHVRPGQDVAAYDLLFDVVGMDLLDPLSGADPAERHVHMEVEGMEEGSVAQLLCAEGDTIAVDQPIAIVCEEQHDPEHMAMAAALRLRDIPPASVLPRAMWQAYRKE